MKKNDPVGMNVSENHAVAIFRVSHKTQAANESETHRHFEGKRLHIRYNLHLNIDVIQSFRTLALFTQSQSNIDEDPNLQQGPLLEPQHFLRSHWKLFHYALSLFQMRVTSPLPVI